MHVPNEGQLPYAGLVAGMPRAFTLAAINRGVKRVLALGSGAKYAYGRSETHLTSIS